MFARFFIKRTDEIIREISESNLDVAFIDDWQAYYASEKFHGNILIEAIPEEKERSC